jgi:hypothetical protein
VVLAEAQALEYLVELFGVRANANATSRSFKRMSGMNVAISGAIRAG